MNYIKICDMTKALFCHDTYYAQDQAHKIRSRGIFPYALWQNRFLPHFSDLTILARKASSDAKNIESSPISSGPNVNHILLDNINTPLNLLFKSGAAENIIEENVQNSGALIIRGPSEIGMIAAKYARKNKIPYAVEASGCAFNNMWHYGSIIGKLYAPIKYLRARHMIKNANAVLYVTEHFLQKRYPNNGITGIASNVDLPNLDNAILARRLNKKLDQSGKMQIGLIGDYKTNLKGIDTAIKALSILKQSGLENFKLRILGQGNPEKWLKLARKFKIEEHLIFDTPVLPGDAVFTWLDALDLYIQPSRTEGLPRALIEAMSRALPCIASNAGGTAELLTPDVIHPRHDAKALANLVQKAWSNKTWCSEHAKRNFTRAKDFAAENLEKERKQFYQDFKALLKV
jgi:glycosyltransferase involved in cell wall biosynthesis